MTARTVFICESSKSLFPYSTEERDLSYQEQIDKAKEDCLRSGYFRTMSPTYLQAFRLYADYYGVLKHWKFVIKKDDGTFIDVTDNTEQAFAMMAKALDSLFEIGIGEDIHRDKTEKVMSSCILIPLMIALMLIICGAILEMISV